MRYAALQEIRERYGRLQRMVEEAKPGDTACVHACAIAYSLDVPLLIAEVEHLNRQIEDRASRVGESA